MYKICFYVPVEASDRVKMAMFKAGAGKYLNYDCCSFETLGTGQFRPLKGSTPFIGSLDQVEKVSELRVEMISDKNIIKDVIKALKESHPYEVVAFDVMEILEF
jgi:hypothetical protein